MKKIILSLAAAAMTVGAIQAQTILSEDFETGNTKTYARPITVGEGWTTIDSADDSDLQFVWSNYYSDPEAKGGPTISGAGCAHVSGSILDSQTNGHGPRQEVLLSPELNLNDTYQLAVSFRVSPMNCQDYSKYDFQVRVVEGDINIDDAPVVFTIQDPEVLRKAGVPGGLITDWSVRNAKIDLSAFEGKKVKLAFVFKMYQKLGNSLWIDDIKVTKFTPATAPVAKVDIDRVAFEKGYIGEKTYSDPITLTNVGLDGLKITSIDFPEGVSTNLNIAKVNLRCYDSVQFNLAYTASLTSAAKGDVMFHTTGGDFTIAMTAEKEFLPEGFTLETFEGYNPPAGWKANGWGPTPYAIEGDKSMSCDGGYGKCFLQTPRLDLTDGGKLMFTYFAQYMDEADYPQYDVTVSVSYDGGTNWKIVWTAPYENAEDLNTLINAEVDLGEGTDNSYVRWEYPAVESNDEGALPHYTFYLDCVMLPNLWGKDGVPGVASDPTPAIQTENVYPFNVKLSWAPAQFATGYKLYIGTTAACNEFMDGVDMGNKLSVVIPQMGYDTRYRWKVVPYNDKGDATGVSTWIFTTQPDATIKDFPYIEDFPNAKETKGALPIGWESDDSECLYSPNRKWSINQYKTYIDANKEEFYPLFTTWLNAGEHNSVTTPTAILPADKPMEVTFVWGDGHAADLLTDNSGLMVKHNVEPNNGVSLNEFQIYSNGEWTTLTTISEAPNEDGKKYWIPERIDLSNYAGQEVRFRWVHYSFSTRDNGCSVARITIEEAKGDKAAFNKKGWNAGKVNYNKSINSGEQFTLFNHGSNDQTIKSVEFATPNFESSLKAGDVLPASGAIIFDITFNALNAEAAIEDEMTVNFESGLSVQLPVSGEALAEKTYYFSFEPNDLEYNWEDFFTTIDVDKGYNYTFSSTSWINFTGAGRKTAFTLESDEYDGKGLYGMMNPVSGIYALVAASPENTNADNWLITRRLLATPNSTLEFYARNLDCTGTVLPDPKHAIEVLVSTAGNTNTKEFETVLQGHEMDYLDNGNWHHYEVDLSKYAGKNIYVALRHYTISPSNVAFFDDIAVHNVEEALTQIEEVEAATDDSNAVIYTVSGLKVAQGKAAAAISSLPRGIYIVKYENGKAISICK